MRRWPFVLGGIVGLLIIAVLVFRWDWLIPLVEARASAALGRQVTIQHLHVDLGRMTRIEADGVTVANPKDWPGGGNFATIERLGLDVDVAGYIKGRGIILPVIDVQAPKVDAQRLADGRATWDLDLGGGSTGSDGPGVQIGTVRIAKGHADVKMAGAIEADFKVDVKTEDGDDGRGVIVAEAEGTYAKQPVTAAFEGGALLSLRDGKTPYPIDLRISNGGTAVGIVGTVDNPLSFAGADIKLQLAGPDMSLLFPLTGIAIPKTPPYRIGGQLNYRNGLIKFDEFAGTVGSSDLSGSLQVDTKPKRPVLTADLKSKKVDLDDLGGFIGAEPGDASKGTKRAQVSNGRVLPNEPISMPKLTVADVHLDYAAEHIEGGRKQPLNKMRAKLDIEDGNVHLHPLTFSIGGGSIVSDIALAPKNDKTVGAKAQIDFKRIDIGTLLASTGIAKGAGTLGGRAVINGTGKSLAEILGHGDGELKLFMGRGGNVSALLVDISGLQFGNALLSALGVPDRAMLQCFALDVGLKNGQATIKTGVLDTNESRVGMQGAANLRGETLGLTLETEGKHFSIGSLPTPIDVNGTFANPGIAPHVGPLALRGGAAVALGIVGTPLAALLPTIDFGTGEDNACAGLLRSAQQKPAPKR